MAHTRTPICQDGEFLYVDGDKRNHMAHTRTPIYQDGEFLYVEGDKRNHIIAHCVGHNAIKDAAFIRICCNNYENMVELLKEIALSLGDKDDLGYCPVCHTHTHKGWCWYNELHETLRDVEGG